MYPEKTMQPKNIHLAAQVSKRRKYKMTIKEMRKRAGFTQKRFAEYFDLPKRTVENWEGGVSNCSPAMLELIEYKLRNEGLLMKKFNVGIRKNMNDCWDYDAVNDYVLAENNEEALELAKDYLKECIINNCKYTEDADKEIEKLDTEYQYQVDELDENDEPINSTIY